MLVMMLLIVTALFVAYFLVSKGNKRRFAEAENELDYIYEQF